MLACLLVTGVGCKRVQEERKLSAETKVALAAIQTYSAASERANASHRDVMTAFADANRSASLPEYRHALRNGVLPAMDTFIDRLEAMPTGTPELKEIHARLVAAYGTARADIAAFETSLEDASGLGRFDGIRGKLQAAVADYSKALGEYYARFDRRLRLDSQGTAAAAHASAATVTTAP